jgi:septum formation protein
MIKIVLASQSPTRREILQRLCIPFEAISPEILEEKSPQESPQQYVQRLSLEKAQKIQSQICNDDLSRFEDIWIIGNDLTGVCHGKIYEKPETLEVGLQFFRDFSENTLTCYSGMTLLSCKTGQFQTAFTESSVKFSKLEENQVRRYFSLCPSALQCASGLKIEGPGAMLLESVKISDPCATPGLPIFLLQKFCKNWGKSLFDFCEL